MCTYIHMKIQIHAHKNIYTYKHTHIFLPACSTYCIKIINRIKRQMKN